MFKFIVIDGYGSLFTVNCIKPPADQPALRKRPLPGRNDILGMGETDQYGRPFAWHQQAARRNFLEAWAAVEAPVLVIFNEFDQFEARHGHKLIADTVNRLRPGSAAYVERPNIGHSDNRYASIDAAYSRTGGTPAWEEAAAIMLDWLRGID